MSKVLLEDRELDIPTWVVDRNAFRRWVHSPAFPEKQKAYWIQGEAWLDMSQEQIFTHVDVKSEFFRVLSQLVHQSDLGRMRQDCVSIPTTMPTFL